MEFFNDIIGTLPYMDFSDSGNETMTMNNPSGLPISKNAIFKVKTGTIYCFDGVLYRITVSNPERTLIQR